jgi:DNA mismatch endonuclease (patch repair protein)
LQKDFVPTPLMADIFTPEKRSEIMRAIRAYNTKPEVLVRRIIHRMGFRFRLHRNDLPGRPDIVLPKHRKIIQVHGCFWHGHRTCKLAHNPKSNQEYWGPKLARTIQRDAKNHRELKRLGWKVLILWECETRVSESLLKSLEKFLECGQGGERKPL